MAFVELLSSLNKPAIVSTAGVLIVLGFPLVPPLPLGFLRVTNLLAFIVNVVAVSVPGRIDCERARRMAQGDTDPTGTLEESSPLVAAAASSPPLPEARDPMFLSSMELRDRTLFRPAAWAFLIWAFIYLGEAAFVVAQFVPAAQLEKSLQAASLPFVAANLLQSLWCASFRPSYDEGWYRFVSCFMLGATAYALSYIPAQQQDSSWFYVPLATHFGWTSAATLVNLNGSIASDRHLPDLSLVAMGNSSVVLATVLGIGITVFGVSTAAYAITIAWALMAIASGVQLQEHELDWSDALQSGRRVQRALAWTGAILCVAAAAFTAYIS